MKNVPKVAKNKRGPICKVLTTSKETEVRYSMKIDSE